jgi:tetratricopeptide (TPR) repeat protein
MDLSGLKWPLIIVLVVGGGWLFTSGGVNWMQSQAMKNTPGVDENQDKLDEATLSRLGGYMLRMWRYDKAIELMEAACDRYPGGANFWYNVYRLHTCYERKGQADRAIELLEFLIANGASEVDPRVPQNDNLSLRANKLKETFELGETS